MRSRRTLLILWIVAALGWIGFIVSERFRIGDAYATGFTLLDLSVILAPPLVLLLIGTAIALSVRAILP